MKLVTQEQPMGCGLACVASAANVSYKKVLALVKREYASTRGFYCQDLVDALKKLGLHYKYAKVSPKNRKYLRVNGTIAFVKRSKRFPEGHFLLKTSKGWMDPWINTPNITPAKAGYRARFPGTAQWILYKVS